jgi:Nif-specific regulatory protein
MERLVYLSAGERIEAEDLACFFWPRYGSELGPGDSVGAGLDLNEATRAFQARYIEQAIARARGNVSQAARSLGIYRSNMYRKMRLLGMETEEDEKEA